MKKLTLALMFLLITATISAAPPITTGTIRLGIEGFLSSNDVHRMTDTVTIYISKTTAPQDPIDWAKAAINPFSLAGVFGFSKITTSGHYYLIVYHRNSMLTWSQPVYITAGGVFNYDFTVSGSQAFGNNQTKIGNKWSIYSGDVNQDRYIDASDQSYVENAITFDQDGYVKEDLTGDNYVDASDEVIVENNVGKGISSQEPYLVLPVKDPKPIKADSLRSNMLLPYTSVIYHNNVYYMYYYIPNVGSRLDTSLNGVGWKFKSQLSVNRNNTPSAGDSLYSIIRRGNTWYSGWTCHSGSGSSYTEWINVATSTNGQNFTQYSGNPLPFHPGEDLSFFDNTDSFYCYIRPDIPKIDSRRKIAVMTSKDFFNWTAMKTIISVPDAMYYTPGSGMYLKQPYNMNVIRVGADWWGFMHVLRLEDDGSERWVYPYTGMEQTIETFLMHSRDGRKWNYTNNVRAFLPVHDSVKQVYGLPTIVGDTLFMYSFEHTLRHAGYGLTNGGQAAVDFAKGKYWKIYRYKILLTDLNTWKP